MGLFKRSSNQPSILSTAIALATPEPLRGVGGEFGYGLLSGATSCAIAAIAGTVILGGAAVASAGAIYAADILFASSNINWGVGILTGTISGGFTARTVMGTFSSVKYLFEGHEDTSKPYFAGFALATALTIGGLGFAGVKLAEKFNSNATLGTNKIEQVQKPDCSIDAIKVDVKTGKSVLPQGCALAPKQ